MDSELMFRIKTYLTENFFRLVPIVALVLFMGLFVYAVQIEKFNRPPEGMRLPAGDAMAKASATSDAPSGLTLQNLGSQEVAARLSNIIAESLSFTQNNFAATTRAMERYFTPSGYAQYKEFLSASGFETALANNLQSGAYIEADPLEITRGVHGGAFKWVYEVPVTISFIARGAETYRDGATTPENRRFTLRAQFTRVKDSADPDAIRIEIWQVMAPRKAN